MKKLLCLAILLGSIAPVLNGAGSLSLGKEGGAALAPTTFSLEGTPGDQFFLLFDISEQNTPVGPGLNLDISLTYATVAAIVPGFLGTLDSAGKAQPTVVLPNDPVVLGLTLSFQAVAGPPIDTISNLVRLTPALSGTYEDTLGIPALPVLGGAVLDTSDGNVLFAGGSGVGTMVYDPNLEEFSLGGTSFGVGNLGQSTGLADGRVLFTGGIGLTGQPSNAAAVFDPTTGQTTTLTMGQARAGHGASLMPDGRVLITGGFSSFDLTDILAFLTGIHNTTEIFDPASSTFSSGPGLLEPRALHSSTAMQNGKLLIAGGLSLIPIINIPTISNTAYAYNPAINSFGLPIFFSGGRMMHSAVELTNGKVLLVGGLNLDLSQVIASGDPTQIIISTYTDCQLYSQGIFGGGFTTVTGMSSARSGAGIMALDGARALIAGGTDISYDATNGVSSNVLATTDIYDASTGISQTGDMSWPRALPLLHNLQDGTILVAGGGPLTAEIYQP